MPAKPTTQPTINSLDYFQQELANTNNPGKVVTIANRLANQAYDNLEACLHRDFQQTEGAELDETDADEAYLEMVRAQCDALKQKIIATYASGSTQEVNQRFISYNGSEINPITALFCFSTIDDTDTIMDICPAKLFDPSSWLSSQNDGFHDKYDLDLDDQEDRERMLAAIAEEYLHSPHQNFSSTT